MNMNLKLLLVLIGLCAISYHQAKVENEEGNFLYCYFTDLDLH